jgi:uncharacterized membrane protein
MNYANVTFWAFFAVLTIVLFAVLPKAKDLDTHKRLQNLTTDAFFIAIILIMGFVPQFGYLTILPWLSLTLLHIPVLIGASLMGWKRGLLYGTIMGLTSWLEALIGASTPLDILFQLPWISVLPRAFFGLASGLVFELIRKMPKIYMKGLLEGFAAFALTVLHTVLVFADLFIFESGVIAPYFASAEPAVEGLTLTFTALIALGMLGVAAIAGLAVPTVTYGLRKALPNHWQK